MTPNSRPFCWVERLFWNLHSRTWDDPLQASVDREHIRARVDWLAGHRQGEGEYERERVLDLGCGTGHYVLELARAGFDAVGIDFAEGMLQKAREKATRLPRAQGAVAFEWGDLNQGLAFPDDSFDHAICIYAIQCVADPPRFLGEMRRVLKPGGLLLLAAPRPGSPARIPEEASAPRHIFWKLKAVASRSRWVQKRSRDELAALLTDAGFGIVEERLDARSVELLARAQEPTIGFL
jgi:ubiquinone/menaquinone biosynthesis C-methylase UbiE